jgi:PAS domain S-box-containing protein
MRKIPQNASKKKPVTFKKSVAAASDDILRHLAFDNSFRANIISTVSSGKIIMANRAACKLLGYSKKELLTKTRATIFDIKESNFKKMLKQRTAEGQSAAFVKAIKKSGKTISCQITSAVFMDEDGMEKSITTIADMSQNILEQKNIDTKKEKIVADDIALAKSKQKNIDIKKEKIVADNIVLALEKSDARVAENKKWINYIAKTSYDVMWDWDIVTGQVYIGESIEEIFGYKLENNTMHFRDLSKGILVEGQNTTERLIKVLASRKKNWNDSFMIKRFDGTVASVTSRASIVRDESGKAIRMIGATQDVSRLQELEKKLELEVDSKGKLFAAYKESFKLIFNSSSDILFDADLVTDEIIVSDAYEKEFGYKITSNMTQAKDWVSHIHPDDKEIVMEDFRRMLVSEKTEWKYSYRFLRADNSVANIFSSRIILRSPDGRAYRIMGSMHDISKQKVLEERLQQEVKLKEKQIAEATEDARATVRADIGKELHDNVNQLLGASKLYLEMAKQGGADSEMYINRSSLYTLSAIEEIRKLSKGLTTNIIKNLGLCEAIGNIAEDTMEVNPVKISCALQGFEENSVNDKFKLNVFRIVQEQLNNILKHSKATKVSIKLLQNKRSITLAVSDNGIGFDTGKKQKGIGIVNIKSRAAAYNGTADFISQPGEGCVLNVTFPANDALLKRTE